MISRSATAIVLGLALTAVSQAQPRKGRGGDVPPHLLMERLSQMSPGERDRLFSGLPPERRSLIEERVGRYSKMPSEAKERLRDEYNSFQQLPPEKQEEVRKLYKQFSELPEDRRPALRRELVRLRNMGEDRRAKRMDSSKFLEDYSDSERTLLTHLVEILAKHPSQAPPSN